ncbi:radical SAM protein [Acetivibrio clariflavus]|uniref:radical SAM protein n=1 Tax=Acetivibrio clariflavus TaxID=288965 RepID=UPI0004BCA2B0|nr:radical SAM protein [Acetivibrio clariflavus]
MKERIIPVKNILPGSIAEEAGIEAGDIILSINGEKIRDIFDYQFLITNENLMVEILKQDGEVWEIEIEKDEYEDLGIEFENMMLDDAKSCNNKCIFCFIDQLPKGMRDTLYFKDDDSRLSFFMGNYVTLTNMSFDDIDRIIKYKMSPINVSVHTTNPDLRVFMLKNKKAGDVVTKIKRLIDGGIEVNCQIVLCRDINDEEELDRTINELGYLYPGVKSISVVPVGITKYRDGLTSLEPYDSESSLKVINQVEAWQKKFKEQFGSRVVYIADEFYIMAGKDIPDYEEYEDFPQIENGVGLIAQLKKEFEEALEQLDSEFECEGKKHNTAKDSSLKKEMRNISIATGVSPYSYIKEMAGVLENRFKNININVYKIENNFFGKNVTVTGLLTGQDLIEQLKNKELGDELLISRSMLKAGEDILLDDYSVTDLEQKLKVKITVVDNDGKDFIVKVLGKVL